MSININKIEVFRNRRRDKIETYANSAKVSKWEAAIYIDQNAPMTTNQKMLAAVDYHVDTVTPENCYDVIEALSNIGVIVLHDQCNGDTKHIAKVLNNVITEEVTECWGGADMQEFVDINPSAAV